jgi:hypothetical protein
MKTAALADHVEEIAIFGRGGIGPMPGGAGIGVRSAKLDEHRPAGRIANVAHRSEWRSAYANWKTSSKKMLPNARRASKRKGLSRYLRTTASYGPVAGASASAFRSTMSGFESGVRYIAIPKTRFFLHSWHDSPLLGRAEQSTPEAHRGVPSGARG